MSCPVLFFDCCSNPWLSGLKQQFHAVFRLQKTLLATFVGNLTLLGESVVPCLHAEAKTSKGNELLQGLFHKACAKFDFITERCL